MDSPNGLSWVTQQKISIAFNHYQSRVSCFPKVLRYLFYGFLLLGLHETRYFKTLLLCHFFEVISLMIISWFSALGISLSIPLYDFRHIKNLYLLQNEVKVLKPLTSKPSTKDISFIFSFFIMKSFHWWVFATAHFETLLFGMACWCLLKLHPLAGP